ncbi:putative endonuclease [Microbacterium sp. cf046]|uniref:YraN family protein n=1 Tax=Microbacterium sp. cf046 TaxID=1761803 RepID=UPI0008EF319E|nr:YraN family protein [Microbacterium sp. cf046]SFS06447.1 putative endonuclease [Microbacterium sp. cf046]
MAAKDVLGRAGEERAARHLESCGYTVVDRNWRIRDGEIDLVAIRRTDLVVVEVKTRRGEGFGHPFEAIDARKRQRLWRLAFAWIAAHPEVAQGRRLRLDAIAIIGADPANGALEHLEDLR